MNGPQAGTRYTVPESGLRLGRSSSCEISLQDPALSRIHCQIEARDGALWITDLASANGTTVNGTELGAESVRLNPGDEIHAGDSVVSVALPDGVEAPALDLGLDKDDEPQDDDGDRQHNLVRTIAWGLAAVAVAGAAALILLAPEDKDAASRPLADEGLRSLSFEKVEASTAKGIYRYALAFDGNELSVAIDDVPSGQQRVRKSKPLEPDARKRLAALFDDAALYRLDSSYAGTQVPGSYLLLRMRVVRGGRVFDTEIENTQEPEEFRTVREQLEAFSKNELGIWAVQYSAEKLQEMSAEAQRTADSKWEERNAHNSNLAAAIAAYDEALFYLETVEPKPATYADLAARRREAAAELDRRYRDQRFRADRASNLGDWETACIELRILCELVPDARDPRHAEAAAKLFDAESRLKKGGRQ